MKKILLIMPDAHMHKLIIGKFKKSFREVPLSLTTLAALVPAEYEVKAVDESIDEIPYDYEADLVGISLLTGTSLRGYQIAAKFRKKGIPVVLGGVHVAIMPDEALKNADSIVIGMAEKTWPKLLKDFANKKMEKVYQDEDGSSLILENVPMPRIDLIRRSGYFIPDTAHATRGCAHRCDFCSASAVWKKYYKRPIADVIRDIRQLPGKHIALNDVSLADDREYAKELFTAMIPLKKIWGGLATASVADDDELLELFRQSGCHFLLIGFESSNQETLNGINKNFNKGSGYATAMQKFHDKGISIQGCFVFGFDSDDKSVFEATVERVNELGIDIPRYSIYTPYPGTPLFERMNNENRIISRHWSDYDTMHVVFQPRLMTVDELYAGFKRAYRETFKTGSIFKRTVFSGKNSSAINFFGNLAYKIFVHRLYHGTRFMKPNFITDKL